MAIIWQSSTFWLMLCTVLLLLVGCTLIHRQVEVTSTSSLRVPTLTPQFSSYHSPDTLFPPIETRFIPYMLYGSSRYHPPERTLQIENPSCYGQANGDLSCVGKLWNIGQEAIGDTNFELIQLDDDGIEIARTQASISQRMTPPNTFATYRTTLTNPVFEQQWFNANDTVIQSPPSTDRGSVDLDYDDLLRVAFTHQLAPSETIRTLRITSSQGALTENGRYQLSVTVMNDSDHLAQGIRLFTTLDNTEWGIVGYDVHEVEAIIPSGAEQALEVEIIPLALPDTIDYSLHVEGDVHSE